MQDSLYIKIYKDLKNDIKNGIYKNGKKLPTEKELSERYNVSRITSQKAVKLLVEDGLVKRRPNIGSFVCLDENNKENIDTKAMFREKKIIGIVLEAIWDSFGIGLFDGAYDYANSLGYELIIKKSYGSQKKETKAIEDLIKLGAEGIIIMPVHGTYYSQEILKLVVQNFHIVFVDRYLSGINVPFIGTNNIQISKECVNYLVNKNHKNIALITINDNEATTLDDRKQGFIEGCTENNITSNFIFNKIDSILPEKFKERNYNETIKNITTFLEENKEITAIITTEYFLMQLTKLALKSINKKIPDDISIICFDSPHNLLEDYEITHVKQDEETMGKEAVKQLINLIKNNEVKQEILLDAKIIEGNSVKNIWR